MRRLIPALLILLLSLTAFAAESADVLKQADIAFCDATRTRGLDGWMSYFADDAVIAQAKAPVYGRDALRAHYQDLFALKDLDFRWTPQQAELFPAGTLGYTSGRYTMSFTGKDGKRVTNTGNYLTVWKKAPDGAWKVLSDFGAPDAK